MPLIEKRLRRRPVETIRTAGNEYDRHAVIPLS